MAAESQVTAEPAPQPAKELLTGPAKAALKAQPSKQDAAEAPGEPLTTPQPADEPAQADSALAAAQQDMNGHGSAAEQVPGSETSADQEQQQQEEEATPSSELSSSSKDSAGDAAEAPSQLQNGHAASETQNGHAGSTEQSSNAQKAQPGGRFSLNASAASFVPGSGGIADRQAAQHSKGPHANGQANGHAQNGAHTRSEGAEYWNGHSWTGPNGEFSYSEYNDGSSYSYGYSYGEGDNWYSYYYPEGYYEGAYYDGTATGRPKARKAKPRKPKGAVTGQGEGAADNAAGSCQDSVLEFGTIRATSLPLGFQLPEGLEGTSEDPPAAASAPAQDQHEDWSAGNAPDPGMPRLSRRGTAGGAGSHSQGQAGAAQQAGQEATTAQRVEAGMAVLRNSLPGLSMGSLRNLLERAQGDVLKALSGLAQQELAAPPPRQQEVPSLDEENFPSLGSSHGQAKPPGDSHSPKARPDTPPKPPGDGFAAAAAKAPAAEGKENRPRNGKPPAAKADKAPAAEASHHWVETGTAVSSMYRQAREEASKHASVRNMCFQQAQMAYLAGNKAQAKQLSTEGRAANERMHAAHAAAAAAIYRQRNPSGKGGQQRTMDLHGLHVNEAIQQLAVHISSLGGAPQAGPLAVIVGTGSHTKGAHHPSRLPAAVRDWLTANYVPFTEPVQGMLHLQL